jgi:hypothetical protein
MDWEDPLKAVVALVRRTMVEHPECVSISTNAIRDIFREYVLEDITNVPYEVPVPDRGDGHGGRIDLLFEANGKRIAIEFDKCTPKKKSLFKLRSLPQPVTKIVILKYGVYGGIRNIIDDVHVVMMDVKRTVSLNKMSLSREARRRITNRRRDLEAEYLRENAEQEMARIRKFREEAPKSSSHTSRPLWKRFRRLMIAMAYNRCNRCKGEFEYSNLDINHLDYRFLGREEPDHCEVVCRPCHSDFTKLQHGLGSARRAAEHLGLDRKSLNP